MDSQVSADGAAAAETKGWARTIATGRVSIMTESCCQLTSRPMRQAWGLGRFARAPRKNYEARYARQKNRPELPWWWWKLLTKTACPDMNAGGKYPSPRLQNATRLSAAATN